MVELHGWIHIRENFTVDCEDENLADILNKISEDIENITVDGLDKNLLRMDYNNGTVTLTVTRFTNHFRADIKEIIDLFKKIAEIAPGSYGLIYLYDDEDSNGLNNTFQVLVVARGTVSWKQDIFLSPYIPTVEDEEIFTEFMHRDTDKNNHSRTKNHYEIVQQIRLDKPNFILGIPKFPKLEQVVPLPFHEKINQFIIDYKEISEKELWAKYNLQSVWHNADDYVVANKKYGNMGKVIINVLVDLGFILQLDYKEELSDYEVVNFWGDEPVKLVQFDLENDQCYYAYIPQSTDLTSIFDVKIYDVDSQEVE